MKKIMIKRSFLLISIIMVLSVSGCIKETYNMKMLSKKVHLSPTMAISAVKGDISFSDAVKTSDTVIFDQNKLVILVFKKDPLVDLKLTDFSKGTIQKTATIDPSSFDLDISDVLKHITGNFKFFNPSIKFNYTNSFPDPVKINLNVTGKRNTSTVALNLAPFDLSKPNLPSQQEITASYVIDKNNSNLINLISLPPEIINYSGSVVMSITTKEGQEGDFLLGANRLLGSLEVQVPLDLQLTNLQFADTVDNFIKDDNSDSQMSPEDFQFLRVNISAKNGFPLGVSMKMSTYNTSTHSKSTVDATGVLGPAPVDSNGKANGVTETSTSIEFTKEFFTSAKTADKIIFQFTLNTTGTGTQEVKIYSDYRINFNAALVVKPDINLK
jgi:hypothetical protein